LHGRFAREAWRAEPDRAGEARQCDPARAACRKLRLDLWTAQSYARCGDRHRRGIAREKRGAPARRSGAREEHGAVGEDERRTAGRRTRPHDHGNRTLSRADAAWLMRAPDFYYRRSGLAAFLLLPFSMMYGAVAGWLIGRPGARAALPVICVGNPTLGGAG